MAAGKGRAGRTGGGAQGQAKLGLPERTAVLHTNLVLVETPDAARADALLERAELRNRLVRRLSPTRLLWPRGALPALRRRLAELDTPNRFAVLEPSTGKAP